MAVQVCINHPMKPANKQCKVCLGWFCKYCMTRETRTYSGEWSGFICQKCDGTEAKRGVMQFNP